MAHADMAEGIDDALVGDNAVGKREFGTGFFKRIGHGRFLFWRLSSASRIIGHRGSPASNLGA